MPCCSGSIPFPQKRHLLRRGIALRTPRERPRVLTLLLEALSPSEAAKIAARITGVPRNELYRRALQRAK